jgi:hypothetical protein
VRTLASAAAVVLSGCIWGGPDECAGYGYGSLTLSLVGLPSGAVGTAVHLTGSRVETFVTAGVQSASSGVLYVSADLVTLDHPVVRTAYSPTVPVEALCLTPGKSAALTVSWAPIPSSHRVWFLNGPGGTGELLGFAAEALVGTGTISAAARVRAGVGRDLAFDRSGNLWAFGAGAGEPSLVRYPAAQLGTGGVKAKDRGLAVAGVSCEPAFAGLAFDQGGNLFVSSPCSGSVLKLPAAGLLADAGTVTPTLVLADLVTPVGLAFDQGGNLLVADPGLGAVVEYAASALATRAPVSTASYWLRATDEPLDPRLLTPSWLAFDAAGSLWGDDPGARVLFTLPRGARGVSGPVTVNPGVRLTLPADAQPAGLAFDEEGGLWFGLSGGKLARLGPLQLALPASAAPIVPERVITSPDVGRAGNVALYPAPSGLPLFDALP